MIYIKTKNVSQLGKNYILVDRDYEVRDILKDYNLDPDIFGCLFVKISDGEYSEVWGVENNIPYLNEIAFRIK